jgi:uncharacterized membrane protein YhaH (DUF805 family)
MIGIGGMEIILLIIVLATVFAIIDIANSTFQDNSKKIIWALLVVFLPVLGVLFYFMIGRGQKKR